jgi:hypothetical protein
MARQYPLAGFPFPVFVNETGTKDYPLPGVLINETSGPNVSNIVERRTLPATGTRVGSRQVA